MIRSVPFLQGLPLAYKAGCVPIIVAISGVLSLLVFCSRSIGMTGFSEPFLPRCGVENCCHTQGSIRFCAPYNMCIETRAGRLLCDTQIKYSPLHMCSGEDDKPSLNLAVRNTDKNHIQSLLFIHDSKVRIRNFQCPVHGF